MAVFVWRREVTMVAGLSKFVPLRKAGEGASSPGIASNDSLLTIPGGRFSPTSGSAAGLHQTSRHCSCSVQRRKRDDWFGRWKLGPLRKPTPKDH